MGYHGAPSTIAERMSGYEDALRKRGLRPAGESDLQILSETSKSTRLLHAVEAFVCVNDRVAGQLMQMFLARGLKIPDEIRVVGIDDVAYASLLPVPLTTVKQPTREIGEAALRVMLERIRAPHQSAREVLLDGQLVIRQSCGANL
jgi:DNA-binding LacI/PurR family transcriptional regulator